MEQSKQRAAKWSELCASMLHWPATDGRAAALRYAETHQDEEPPDSAIPIYEAVVMEWNTADDVIIREFTGTGMITKRRSNGWKTEV